MPQILYWFLRFSILNPLCIRIVGAASRRHRDLYIRSGYLAILAAVLLFGLLSMTSSGRFSLRDLAAGSAGVFTFLAVIQLVLICILTPVFMSGAISKEANPRTWDILLTTPLSPLQIVLGNLFGRLFLIFALLVAALPLMIVTQFFGGVPLETILLTQIVSITLGCIVASAAIGLSVTRTAGRKAAVNFFIVTVLFILVTYVVDHMIRQPIAAGTASSWTTILTPLNPFLVLESLLVPSGYSTPQSSQLAWPIGWLVTHPVAGWVWITMISSVTIITWSSLQVRKLGDRSCKESIWKRLTKYDSHHREPHAVSGNPIAWRERVTRHRNIGSLLGSWGFVSIFGLTFIILATLFLTRYISGDAFRDFMLFLVAAELMIVTFFAISLSASSIAKEREDGSLDLLLTTSITPKLYLGGKMRGLVMHLFPMALVPCITMIVIGLLVLFNPQLAVVSDAWSGMDSQTIATPLALYLPAFLFPLSFVPYISFCMVLGLMWSMRSKGTIGAIITTLVLVFVLTAGLGVCLIPVHGIPVIGIGLSSLSPFSLLLATVSPVESLPSVLEDGVWSANISLGVTTVLAGVIWTGLCLGLLRSMSASFVTTVRRLAGVN